MFGDFCLSDRAMEPASVVAAVRTVDLDELQKHTTEKDCYMLYNGKVYDVTEFLDEHPGGEEILITKLMIRRLV